jgi:exodeoxyribonuclease III
MPTSPPLLQSKSLVSWNLNGLRAAERRGFSSWLQREIPDIVCLQETRIQEIQVQPYLSNFKGYHTYWNSSQTPGYSGTALLTRLQPTSVEFGIGHDEFDREGRAIVAQFPGFAVVNCYVPNGNSSPNRLKYKLGFYRSLQNKCRDLASQGKTVIVCGDMNTAHNDIDLAKPQSNRNKSGFLSRERTWIDRILQTGFVDSFRHQYPAAPGKYTWWANTYSARSRNVGWRFDYVFVSECGLQNLVDAFILSEVECSDHCPIGIRFR